MLVEMEELNTCLLKDLKSCGRERDGIKHMKSLRSGEGRSEKNEPPATATDVVFSSDAANNYYQAMRYYKMKTGSNTSKDNDGSLPKNKTSNSNNDNDDLPLKSKSWRMPKGGSSVYKTRAMSEENSGDKSKSRSWKKLKGDNCMDNTTIKSEETSGCKSVVSGGKSVTSLQEIMDYVTKKGKEPAEVVEYLKNVDKSSTNKAEKRHTRKLLAEAQEKNNFYMDIVKFLMKAEEAKRKEEEDEAALFKRRSAKSKEDEKGLREWDMDKYLVEDAMKRGGKTPVEIVEERKRQELIEQAFEQAMNEYLAKDVKKKKRGKQKEDKTVVLKCFEKLFDKTVKDTQTPTALVDPTLKIEEDKRVLSEREMNEQLVKDAMKQGAKTPAEIALHLLKIDEENKTQELVEQALIVCKSPKEIADYLMKVAKENQREDETSKEQESSKEFVSDAPKQEARRLGVAENLLTKSGKYEGSQARPRGIFKRSIRPPVESLECDIGEMSTTYHLKSTRSIDSAMSTECSIMTEIVNPKKQEMGNSPRAVSQNKQRVSPTRSVSFAKGTKETSESKYEKQDSSKITVTYETSSNNVADKKDVGEAQLDETHNHDNTPCSWGVQLISEEPNEENQEITLDAFYAGYIKESHSASDENSVRDAVEEGDKEGQKNCNCIGQVEKGEDSISDVEECEVVSKSLLKSKLKSILTSKKNSLPKKALHRKASENSTKNIARHEANSSDASGATQSCSSNESIPLETKPVKKKIVEFNLEDGTDRPITSISIPAKVPAIYDEVTLPSVLRRKSRPNNLNEPLEEWISDMSILDDENSETSGPSTTQFTIDPYCFMEEDPAEERCTCSANEVKDYTAEMSLIACEVLDFCSAKARKASSLLGFDSEGLSKSINTTQEEEAVVEKRKIKRIVSDVEADNIEICLERARTNDSKRKKRSFKRLGLRNSSRFEI